MLDNSRCTILVPVLRYCEPHTELTLRQLEAQGYRVERLFGYSQIDRARNRLASEALTKGFEELFWIDGDMAFEPQSVDRLRSHDLPLVCGLYPTKVEKKLTSQLLPGTSKITFGRDGGLVEIRYAATGFFYTRRQVYLDVQKKLNLPTCNPKSAQPLVPFFLPIILEEGGEHHYLSEDYSFCERARQCGYRIYADTTVRLQHIGLYGYSWEDLGASVPRYPTYHLQLKTEE